MANLKDVFARGVSGLHRALFDISGGRLLGRLGKMPIVELETTGRRSGKIRKTMLASPLHEDDRVVLVASYGGDDRHPAWFLNLRDNPSVAITIKGERREMKARLATNDEKAELWPRIVAAYKGYAGYQKRTDRDIPVVVLTPA
ncbi:MAG: nitroreductase family deazaflavin-dependent oxidoreductase [Acidimicrobiales bacterium]